MINDGGTMPDGKFLGLLLVKKNDLHHWFKFCIHENYTKVLVLHWLCYVHRTINIAV